MFYYQFRALKVGKDKNYFTLINKKFRFTVI